jgi:hypothetical protein
MKKMRDVMSRLQAALNTEAACVDGKVYFIGVGFASSFSSDFASTALDVCKARFCVLK